MPPSARVPVWVQDLLTALVVGAAWFAVITVMERGDYWYPSSPASYRVAGVAIVLTIALRRVVPGPLFWVTVMLYPLVLPWAIQTPFELLPLMIAGFAATRSGAVPWVLASVAGAVSAFSLLLVWRPALAIPPRAFYRQDLWVQASPSDVLVALALVLGAVAAGVFFRRLAVTSEDLRVRNTELQELQAELAERAVLAERTRIARELHDVVAHHMSAIVVRAQAADRVAPNQPEAPREAVRWISDEGKQALTSMRSVVHVLRREDDGDGGAATLAPTPTATSVLDELRAAARRTTDAGRDVDLTLPEPWPTTSTETGLAVVRITQEALTNVLLHSLAPDVTVVVTVNATHVGVRVHDPGPPLPDDPAGRTGFGLSSMRERAAATGGRLVAGPDGHGGWSVEASLPRGAR
ncbi:hypothetical protein IF650_08560 [Cellulosimicrobium terreum]|nr:hypothetical protein [Cellulosimicrobium terreum]